MEEAAFNEPRRRAHRWIWGILLALALVAAAAGYAGIRVKNMTMTIQLAGEEKLTLEYGEAYEEPGAQVLVNGAPFGKKGADVQVKVSGGVNENNLGRYVLTYSADYRSLHAEARRTVQVVDTKSPIITLKADPENSMDPGTVYKEEGFTAVDNYDGDITDRVIRTEAYGHITYAVTDSSGNPAVVEREVPYYDPLAPKIELTGGEEYAIPAGIFYCEPGYSATDNVDGDLTEAVTVEGEVDWLTPGTYPITYTVTDSYENVATVIRNVTVTAKPRPETIYPEGKTIYLTFDDGPGAYTERLLDILDSYGVKATFFVTNSGNAELMKEIVDRGHSIGIHSVTHNYAEIYASPTAYFTDLYKMQDIIYQNTGVRTTLLRFPGGSSNEVSCKTCEGLMTLLTEAVQNAGFQYFDWNVYSGDAGETQKTQEVVNYVLDGVRQHEVSIVLQHDIHSYSVDAVEDIIVWGLNNGYTFRPLTENSPGFHHDVNN